MREIPAYCPICQRQVLARRTPANNTFHLLLTVFTAGLWLIPWYFIALSPGAQTYFCTFCGTPLLGPHARRGRSPRGQTTRQVKSKPVAQQACPACGHLNAGARRCVKCGTDLGDPIGG